MTTTVPAPAALASTPSVERLRVKIFADGANLEGMLALYRDPRIAGFTTNPTLMRQVGVSDYRAFAREVIAAIPDRSISFEVFSDELNEMERQAREIASWGEHVYVKIPVTDTTGQKTEGVLRRLSQDGIKLNVTGLMTLDQVAWASQAVGGETPACISVFAGRIADTGIDPVPVMAAALQIMSEFENLELIWASPRELLNVVQADEVGCHIITVTHYVLKKLPLLGRDLAEYSLETVRMFHRDAASAGLTL
jgi:transaldolase